MQEDMEEETSNDCVDSIVFYTLFAVIPIECNIIEGKPFKTTISLFRGENCVSTVKTSANAASLQSTFDRLQQWCANWQLAINTQQCCVLHLGFTIQPNTIYLGWQPY